MKTLVNKKVLILGAGLSGLVAGRLLKDLGYQVEIHEKNLDIGGLLNDQWDSEAKCYISWCGPHIFHMSKERGTLEAFKFLSRFTEWNSFDHRVLALGPNGSFTFWPISNPYDTLFRKLNPTAEPFDYFVKNYSEKMWGDNSNEVIKNIRNRFAAKDSNSNLFFEGQKTYIPKRGFLNMLKKLSNGLEIKLDSPEDMLSIKDNYDEYDKIIVTSPVDDFFLRKFGSVGYRGMDFEFFDIESDQSILPTPVVNLNSHSIYTRISEMNQFYNSKSKKRVLCLETPSNNGRFYPIQTKENLDRINQYVEYSKEFPKIILLGRQSEGKYFDIDTATQNVLNKIKEMKL